MLTVLNSQMALEIILLLFGNAKEFFYRIVVCFVESNRIAGDYGLNPFVFNRKWTVTEKAKAPTVEQRDTEASSDISDLQRRLEQAEDLNRQLLAQLNKGKGPQRGKRSRASTSRPQASTSAASRRFYQFPEADNVSISSDESALQQLTATTKTIYLKKVQLLLNGHPIDGLEGNGQNSLI